MMRGGVQSCEENLEFWYKSDDAVLNLPEDLRCCNEPQPAQICLNGQVRLHDPEFGLSIDLQIGDTWDNMCE